jgi:hypothetical protein
MALPAVEPKVEASKGPSEQRQSEPPRQTSQAAPREGVSARGEKPAADEGAVPPDATLVRMLKQVTGKAENLVGRMAPDEKLKVHGYLTSGVRPEHVKKVLHFGDKKKRQASTDDSRVEIRRKLLAFLAAGGTPEAAIGYRNQWAGITGDHLADLMPVAGQNGVMTMAPLLGGLKVPPENLNLTQQQVGRIRDVFEDVMGKVKYNSAAVPLRFVEELRKGREKDPHVRLAEVFNRMAPTDRELFDAAGGADCVGMASIVRARLTAEGIGSYVIGARNSNYLSELPSHTRERMAWRQAKDFAVYAHASIVVPYTDGKGVPRAIHIETGKGPDPENFKEFTSLALAKAKLESQKYDVSRDVDPAVLAQKHVQCKWRMYLSSDVKQERKVFIDLIEGAVWLSGNPEADVKVLKGLGTTGLLEGGGTKLRFEEALKKPKRKVELTVSEDEVKRISASQAVELFFRVVAKQFALPEDEFVREMMWLARNIEEFRQTILLDPVAAIAKVMPARTEALAAHQRAEDVKGTTGHLVLPELDKAADNEMAQALAAANAGKAGDATAHYEQAIAMYGKVEQARKAAQSSASTKKTPEAVVK